MCWQNKCFNLHLISHYIVQQDEPLSKSGSVDNDDAATTIQKGISENERNSDE